MKHNLGSRKRFLFRLVTYFMAPLLGLTLIISPPPLDADAPAGGGWLGWIAMAVGLVAQYMLLSRLQQPVNALRYAIQPSRAIAETLASLKLQLSEQAISTARVELMQSLKKTFEDRLPDVAIDEIPGGASVSDSFILGDEFILLISAPPGTDDEIRQLAEKASQLRRPLHNDQIWIVLLDKIQPEMKKALLQTITAKLVELN